MTASLADQALPDMSALHAELRTLIASSRQRLTQEFGRGFEAKNLRRTADEKTEMVANCDHLQHLKFSKALPFLSTEPPRRPIGFLTQEDKRTPKASTLTKGRKAP